MLHATSGRVTAETSAAIAQIRKFNYTRHAPVMFEPTGN
jgi:hypothetical protein